MSDDTAPSGEGGREVLVLADIDVQHRGWEIRLDLPLPTLKNDDPARRYYEVKDFRHYENGLTGEAMTAVTVPCDGPWYGAEHSFPSNTPCAVTRQITKKPGRRFGEEHPMTDHVPADQAQEVQS